ncbi:hypothetical protein H0H87_012621 [Tephrocybe sp. NHM501043]|nr:hypothetical protein H0H87_012621 [Tephrocybe sp. NHM501043]
MHPALDIHELLYLIFLHLLQDDRPDDNRRDLLACALTCKIFSEAALDVIWQKPPSVAVLPFGSPSEYESTLNPHRPGSAYAEHLERLKFYGKRVRALRVHSKLTPELFRCIMQLRGVHANAHSDSHGHIPLISRIFPLTSLSLVLSVNPLLDSTHTAHHRIHTFLLPTVKTLYVNCAAGARYDNLTAILHSISLIPPHAQPPLTSLTLDWEIISRFSEAPPLELDLALSNFISTLSHLQTLSLPFYLLTEPVFTAIAALPELREITLGQPAHAQLNFSNPSPWGPFSIPSSELAKDAFAFTSLRGLVINSTFKYIPHALNAHPALTQHLTHLSLSCAPPPPRLTLRALFPSASPTPLLHNLTHLSINFKSITPAPPRDIDIAFLRPLFDGAPLMCTTANLVSLHIVHAAPLDLDDAGYEEIARCLGGVVDVRFDVVVRAGLREGRGGRGGRRPKRKIRASLGAIEAFVRHCRRLRRITIVVDAESSPLPPILPIDEEPTLALPHPVYVDLSISPIGPDVEDVARFFGGLLGHRSEVRGRWNSGGGGGSEKGGGEEEEEDGDVYARRWEAVGEVLRSARELGV